MQNKIILDTQIFIANFAPEYTNNLLEKNVQSWGDVIDKGFEAYMTPQSFSEIVWLLFKKTYKKILDEKTNTTAKIAMGIPEVREAVADKIIYPFINAVESSGIKMLDDLDANKIVEGLVKFGADINDFLIYNESVKNKMMFKSNDGSLNKWIAELSK